MQNLKIYNQLLKKSKRKNISFYVPGHKKGVGFNPRGRKTYKNILKIDLTELNGLDNLHQPQGVIKHSQEVAAKVFGADYTFYLVNGSTSGNIAMILSVCNPGDKVIVQRNVHKSIINALILAKAVPIYISPEHITSLNIAGSVNVLDIKKSLEEYKDIKAVILMNPNYYGIGIEVNHIANLVHNYEIPLLIDEAHGAHFGFHSSFPKSSISMGADIVVQSTHKTLSAMTMGSMLHVKSNLININRLKKFLSIIQTSSPSYPIMASLELTTNWLENKGEKLWNKQIKVLKWLKETTNLNNLDIVHTLEKKYYIDPLKIIISSKYSNLSGYFIQRYLEKYNIYTELADFNNTLLIITMGNKITEIKYLKKILIKLDKYIEINFNEKIKNNFIEDYIKFNNNTTSNLSLDKVLYEETIDVSIDDARGKVSAEMIIPYPPGIPILNYGEIITEEIINYIIKLKENNIIVEGIEDTSLNKIKILAKL